MESGTPPTSCCGNVAPSGVLRKEIRELPGYRIWPFVEGWIDTPAGTVPRVKTRLEGTDVLGRWQMRWGIGRYRYRITPGLYAVGNPDEESPVLVTANYKLSFDTLRAELTNVDAWILVLETDGINVWCAAGKGTFGTDELVRRVLATRLREVVSHHKIIVPQLGAPGVAAHAVRKGCGFSVVYGPVRAADVKAFLAAGMKATPGMRQVTFTTMERLVLTPVELSVIVAKPALWVVLGLFALGGIGPGIFSPVAAWHRGVGGALVALAAILAGAVVTPVLLPWLPWRAFSAKGALVGGAVGVAAVFWNWGGHGGLESLALLLALPALSSYCAMNFTGATPYTSPSGVEKEMRRAIPFQAAASALAGVLWITSAFTG
jgi:hypothetical protein